MRKSFLLLALMVAAMVTAFARGRGESPEAGEASPTMDAFVVSTGEWYDYTPENNRLVEYFEREFDVTFRFVIAPEETADEQKSLLLASGDYPSVFFHGGFSKSERQRYGGLGVLQPLNELIDMYAPNVRKVLETDADYAAGTYAPDGNIYALPHGEMCYHCFYTPKMWINTQWLENLGLEMPRTTAEFERVLIAFRDQDPNRNGVRDEIPFSGYQGGWFTEPRSVLLSPFLYVDTSHYLRVENGRIIMTATESTFRDALVWAHGLYEQGLIDPQAFTQDSGSFATIAQNPDAALVGVYVGGHQLVGFDSLDPERWNQYFVLPPLEGPNGHRAATYRPPSYAEAGFAITNRASEDIARIALEMMNSTFTLEGALTAIWGPRGTLWDWPEEGALGMRGEPAVFNTYFDRAEPGVVYGFEPPLYFPLNDFLGWGQDQDINVMTGYERRLTVATDIVAQYTPREVLPGDFWMTDEEADLYAQFRTEFNSFITQNVVAFITGQQSIVGQWDAFQRGLRGLGIDQYLGLIQKAYDSSR